jgi:putative addiction module component (TIGR02574 family)
MPMTPDQIIEEASHLPYAQVAELVDRLMLTLDTAADSEIAAAWKSETRRRLTELEDGRVQAIPGDVVSQRIRQIVGR